MGYLGCLFSWMHPIRHTGRKVRRALTPRPIRGILRAKNQVVHPVSSAERAVFRAVDFASLGVKDLENAERNFRAIIRTIPSLGIAHNNLGFVLLAKGQVEDALAAFKRAEEVGSDRLELIEANMACCQYLLGNTAASSALFEDCLDTRSFTRSGMLYGISGDRLFLVSVPSAGAYTRLIALNAGWSALRAGNPEVARARAAIAIGLLGIVSDQSISDSLVALTAELGRHNARA